MDNSLKEEIASKINAIVLPMLLLLALVGNTFSFIVYSRRSFANLKTSLYLRILCITDTFESLISTFIFLDNGFYIPASTVTGIGCKLFKFIQYTACACSAQIEAFISFERMLNVVAPNQSFKIHSIDIVSNASILAIFIINISLYMPILVTYEPVEIPIESSVNDTQLNQSSETSSFKICQSADPNYDKYLYWYDLANSTLMPFLIMLICTLITINGLNKSRSRTKLNKTAATKPNKNEKMRQSKDFQFALTSIMLCVVFFVLNIGIVVFFILYSYNLVPAEDFNLLFSIFNAIFYSDNSIKFFIYILVNSRFRREFFYLFKQPLVASASTARSQSILLNQSASVRLTNA